VVALGKIGDPMAVEPLIDKLESDDYFYVRKKAAYTLYVFYKQERLEESLRQKILSHWRSWYLT
jgi:HEAT repeat protein